MVSHRRDVIGHTTRRAFRPGIARHKDQKSFRAIAHADSQTPKALDEKSDAYAYTFFQTKESFADSLANTHAEE